MTECLEQFLMGTSKKYHSGQKIEGSFDIFIFSLGWERRCYKIIDFDSDKLSIDIPIVLSFNYNDEIGYNSDYKEKMDAFFSSKGLSPQYVEIKEKYLFENSNSIPCDASPYFEMISNALFSIISNILSIKQRPLSIGFDISSCPRRAFLFILGQLLKNNLFKDISFFYAEGKYASASTEYAQTKGDWALVDITEFRDIYDPQKKSFFIISAGFEGSRYRSWISKKEPDNIGILLPDPGFNDDYTKTTHDECSSTIEDYYILEENVVRAPAGDAIEAWRQLMTPSLNKEEYNITYLTFGPKPHVLAMGLHGFLHENIFVTSRIPKGGYTKMDVFPTDIIWEYSIRNLLFF